MQAERSSMREREELHAAAGTGFRMQQMSIATAAVRLVLVVHR